MANKYTNFTGDGSSDEVRVRGRTHIHGSGDFGGGTLKIEYKDPTNTWRDIFDADWTSAFDDVFDFTGHIDTPIRATLTGATNPNLHVDIRGGH